MGVALWAGMQRVVTMPIGGLPMPAGPACGAVYAMYIANSSNAERIVTRAFI